MKKHILLDSYSNQSKALRLQNVALDQRTVDVPEGVEVSIDGSRAKVKGPKGELTKDFSHILTPLKIVKENGKVRVEVYGARKEDKAVIGTVAKHLRNMMEGVTKGFTCTLKTAYAHFPISVKVQGNKILIENFTGERRARVAWVAGSASVSVKGDELIVQGISKDDVFQTAANIECATKIRRKDSRVFLDGIYLQRIGIGDG